MTRARVAIVHDWLTGMRGGERVLEALIDLFPAPEIFTLIHRRGSVSAKIEARPIHESALARLPGARERYRYLLPLFPRAAERFDLRGFDLVVSSSHCVAKGALARPGTPHVCYCHTPMRYVWDQYDAYFQPGRASVIVRGAAALWAPRLRDWDVRTSRRVTRFIANSAHVQDRIERYFQRQASVVYPPVGVERFRADARREDVYVCVSALVPYKRIDVAVRAFNALGRPLVIIGEGPERRRLAAMARPNIRFAGRVSDDEVADRLGRARAFIMPGEEDFGIAAVEAQAAGSPVIALGRGGVLETVIDADDDAAQGTGLFFKRPDPADLADAIVRFERMVFDPGAARRNAERFSADEFARRMRGHIDDVLESEVEACASPR